MPSRSGISPADGQGQADPPLTHTGMVQARAAAAALNGIDSVVTSDLDRARATAVLIAEVLEVGPVTVDADWRERDAGAWQGLTRAEIERDYPGHIDQGRYPARVGTRLVGSESSLGRTASDIRRERIGPCSRCLPRRCHLRVWNAISATILDGSTTSTVAGSPSAPGGPHLGRRVTLVGHDADPAVTETR